MEPNTFWTEVTNTFRRVARSNFQIEQATTGERVKLASSPVPLTDPLVQNYAVWRKGVLWIAGIAFIIVTLVQIIGFRSFATQTAQMQAAMDPTYAQMSSDQQAQAIEFMAEGITTSLGQSNIEVLDGVQIIILLGNLIGTILIILAAVYWHLVPRSKRLVRAGWLTMFLTPVVLSMLPVTGMLEWDQVDGQVREQIKAGLGLSYAFGFFLFIGPKAISLFAGTVRSSMTLKTLLPEATGPGWAAVMMAPLYALFLIVITSIVLQLRGDFLLTLSLICFTLAPLVYVWNASGLIAPMTREQMPPVINRIRLVTLIFNGSGALLLLIFVFANLIEYLSFWRILDFLLGLVASLAALTVVASDFILALLWKSYEQSKKFFVSPHREELEQKFNALSTVGLTKLAGGMAAVPVPASAAPPVPAGNQTGGDDVLVELESEPPDESDKSSSPPPPPAGS